MAIRRLYGTQTLGGHVFWTDIAEEGGWRIQYNKTLDAATPLNPYRLISPADVLWASADTAEELMDSLPELMDQFASQTPLVDRDDIKKIAGALAAAISDVLRRRIKL